jgi:hypothetical protein
MAVAAPRRVRQDYAGLPTSPLRILSGDHQPIRLLAELEGITVAELVHRAVAAYMAGHRRRLADLSAGAQQMVATGDLDGLARILRASKDTRRASRAGRLAALSESPEVDEG